MSHIKVHFKGLMEFARVDKSARSKRGGWKMQEWTYRHDVARVDNAGVDLHCPPLTHGADKSTPALSTPANSAFPLQVQKCTIISSSMRRAYTLQAIP